MKEDNTLNLIGVSIVPLVHEIKGLEKEMSCFLKMCHAGKKRNRIPKLLARLEKCRSELEELNFDLYRTEPGFDPHQVIDAFYGPQKQAQHDGHLRAPVMPGE